uniref:Sodium/glucose cotransporter 4 n=1 Tax=Schistocephalus solidus TaxID=70667 RepID=A0A183TT84_SCHSO
LFASNIGSGHFIGLAGSGASSGIAIAVFEFNAIFILALLGWLFLPVYIVSGVSLRIVTVPEYLRKRLGGQRIRVYLAVIALLLYIFSKISADLYAGGIFIQLSMQISMYPAVILLLIMSALFTIMGLQVTGGFDNLVFHYLNAIPNTTRAYQSTPFTPKDPATVGNFEPDLYGTNEDRIAILDLATTKDRNLANYAECSIPPSDAMNFFKAIHSTELPWVGVIFGLSVNSTWYWCTDQVIVQRTLAAKNLVHARAGIILACLCKMLPLWLMVIPGMAARILFTDTVACGSAELCTAICGKAVGCSDIAYPSLVLNILPSGARGLMIAVMMASLVSSLTSIFNSSSTIFTVDLWKLIRPNCKDAEVMIVGRVCVIVLVGVSIAWIPIVQLSDELFDYIQAVTAYLAPPICAVYVLAVFWKRTNEIGCFVALIVGLIIGITRFGWELGYPKSPCGQTSTNPPHELIRVHFLHFSILLFGISSLVIVCVSLITPPLPEKYVSFLKRPSRFWENRL